MSYPNFLRCPRSMTDPYYHPKADWSMCQHRLDRPSYPAKTSSTSDIDRALRYSQRYLRRSTFGVTMAGLKLPTLNPILVPSFVSGGFYCISLVCLFRRIPALVYSLTALLLLWVTKGTLKLELTLTPLSWYHDDSPCQADAPVEKIMIEIPNYSTFSGFRLFSFERVRS